MSKKLTEKNLTHPEIRNLEINGEMYYSIEDVKKLHEDYKFETINAITFQQGKKSELFIKAVDIHPMTEFDKKIQHSLNYNPKN